MRKVLRGTLSDNDCRRIDSALSVVKPVVNLCHVSCIYNLLDFCMWCACCCLAGVWVVMDGVCNIHIVSLRIELRGSEKCLKKGPLEMSQMY